MPCRKTASSCLDAGMDDFLSKPLQYETSGRHPPLQVGVKHQLDAVRFSPYSEEELVKKSATSAPPAPFHRWPPVSMPTGISCVTAPFPPQVILFLVSSGSSIVLFSKARASAQ